MQQVRIKSPEVLVHVTVLKKTLDGIISQSNTLEKIDIMKRM